MLPIDLANVDTSPFESTPEHAALRGLVGLWRGPTRLWLDPSEPPEESLTELHAELVLGGRWLRISYRGTAFGKPHAGEMLIGYHKDAGQHELAWVDSVHTASSIILSVGAAPTPGVIDVLGSYDAMGQRWGWRTRIVHGADELTLEAFNIPLGGPEEHAIASVLARVG